MSNKIKLGKMRAGAIAIALSALLLPACGENNQASNPGAEGTEETTAQEAENVTAKEVADKTDQLIGQNVTIRTNAINKISPSTFAVTDDNFLDGETILVVNDTGETETLPEGTELQITGKVEKVAVDQFNKEYKLNLNPSDYEKFEGKAGIIAKSIALAPKPGEITSNPDEYYNKVIAVPGKIQEVQGKDTFTLEDNALLGGSDLLVLVPKDNPVPAESDFSIQKDETVVATGTLRKFTVAEIEKEYGFSWDTGVREQLEADYENKPVLVVNSIYPSALPDDLSK